MGLTPDQVREMTILDFFTALHGHNQANKPSDESQAPTLDEHQEMKRLIEGGNNGTRKQRP